MVTHEVNFDGIVGPTHNYAGLSWGNVASMKHKLSVSNPKQAALEGLMKMRFLAQLGVKQAMLPPHERPHISTLRRLGFNGSDAEVLHAAHKHDPALLAAASSASAMWAANAATVSGSADCADGRVHFTPANLISTLHRSIEAETTARVLKRIFVDEKHFVHHDPLPSIMSYADEGAANHTRLWSRNGGAGVNIFTYGRDGAEHTTTPHTKFPARQTRFASLAIVQSHQLEPSTTAFFKQTPRAIDAGAFHNDVVCVGHRNVLLLHGATWEHQKVATETIVRVLDQACGEPLHLLQAGEVDLPLGDAIKSYLFNSQLVTLPDDSIALIAPTECRDNPAASDVIELAVAANHGISAVHFVDVRQSMRNGGGPACLRLRVPLTDHELSRVHGGVLFDETLDEQLRLWIERHYRDELRTDDLADPKLLDESRRALDELTRLLRLGNLYGFQQ